MKADIKANLDSVISNLISKVEEAGSWVKPFQHSIQNGLPFNTATGKGYSGINIFNLWLISQDKGYKSNEWATFKQLKAKGYKVNKGEKATDIFFFKPIQIKEEVDGETKTKTIPLMKMYKVFNLEQTDAPQAEETEQTEEDKIKVIDTAEEFYSNLDYLTIGRGNPSYSPVADRIEMPSMQDFISAEEYYSTLGHEYIHSTGHKTRLNREGITSISAKFGTEAYAFEELIAEIGSVLLMAHLGLNAEPVQDNSASYLKSWLRKLQDDPKQLWKASSEATKAFQRLLDASELRADKREVA